MRLCTLAGSACALLLAFLGAPSTSYAAESQSTAGSTNESIVFQRSVYVYTDPRAPDFGTALFRVNPATRNVVQMTPLALNAYNRGGSWSPHGAKLVYEHYTQPRPDHSQLFVVDRQGTSHRITSGVALHEFAVWGPKAQIAFITDFGDQQCLSAVRADGTNQRLLFCPLNQSTALRSPQWSLDGKSIYLAAARRSGSGVLSIIFRYDFATRLATKIFSLGSYTGGIATIAPDGTHAIYTDTNLGPEVPATLVDLTTGATTTLPGDFHGAKFSHDGRRIAFSRYETIDGTLYLSPYVMNADGSNQHRVIDTPTPGASYTIMAWSKDNCHLLVDPYLDGNRVWIIDTESHQIAKVTKGMPNSTGWYEP